MVPADITSDLSSSELFRIVDANSEPWESVAQCDLFLRAAGITTPEQLDEVGAVEAYRRIVLAGAPDHTMLLWALDAALLDVDWRDLPVERRQQVRAEARRALGRP